MGECAWPSVICDVKPGNMVFEPILEEGVFRFASSTDAKNTSFPSLSFANAKERDTPLISNHKLPSYIPTSEHVAGQQIVDFEVSLTFLKILFFKSTIYGMTKASEYGY